MLDNSVYYGLQNPAFTKDIGYGMIDAMYPCTADIDPVSGTVETLPVDAAAGINNGQPASDVFQSGNKNNPTKKHTLRNILLLSGAAIAALAGFKFRKPIMAAAGKVVTPIKNFFNNLVHKSKTPSP